MKLAVVLAAVLAVAMGEVLFFNGEGCEGEAGERIPSDTCVPVSVQWAGESIRSFDSDDLIDEWRFAANWDTECMDVYVQAALNKNCIKITPAFHFESGNYGSIILTDE